MSQSRTPCVLPNVLLGIRHDQFFFLWDTLNFQKNVLSSSLLNFPEVNYSYFLCKWYQVIWRGLGWLKKVRDVCLAGSILMSHSALKQFWISRKVLLILCLFSYAPTTVVFWPAWGFKSGFLNLDEYISSWVINSKVNENFIILSIGLSGIGITWLLIPVNCA